MIILQKNKHTLQINEFHFKCSIGKNGISNNKIEGDKSTPKGIYELEHLYFRTSFFIKGKKPYYR